MQDQISKTKDTFLGIAAINDRLCAQRLAGIILDITAIMQYYVNLYSFELFKLLQRFDKQNCWDNSEFYKTQMML